MEFQYFYAVQSSVQSAGLAILKMSMKYFHQKIYDLSWFKRMQDAKKHPVTYKGIGHV